MGPRAKRTASDAGLQEVTGQSTGVAKVKAKKGKVEAETVGAAEARMEELRKKYVAANPYNEVPTNEQWIEVIGQALARERRFMTIMGNPPKLQDLTISRVWLASLHLPGRKDPLPARWIKWFKQVTDQAIARAVEIFQTCTASYQQTSAYRTAIDPPPDDEPTRKVRQQIFLYQTVRQRMGETVHQISKQEMILVQRVLAKNNNTSLSSTQEAVADLKLLEEAKQELRQQLQGCTTEAIGKAQIDRLLTSIPQGVEGLIALPAHIIDTGLDGDGTKPVDADELDPELDSEIGSHASISDESFKEALSAIDGLSPFDLHFYDPTVSGTDDVIIHGRSNPKVELFMDDEPQIDQLKDIHSIAAVDTIVAKALNTAGDLVDARRFKVNMEHFIAIKERPAVIKNAKHGSSVFRADTYLVELCGDNMFHVKILAAKLKKDGLFRPDIEDDTVQQCLLRMWALVAILYGCAPEGGLWLSVMDSLLEDFASMLIGSLDPHLSSSKIQKFYQMRQQGSETVPELSTNDISILEQTDRSRRLFAELARFYRGACQFAFVATTFTSRKQDRKTTWYEGLIRWSYICGAETCTEKLVIHKLLSGSNEERDGSTKDGKKKKKAAQDAGGEDSSIQESSFLNKAETKADFATKTTANLSVSVYDPRAGYPGERAEISKNRAFAYPCPFEWVDRQAWHPAFGLFFHHFAHLWHSTCLPLRGKTAFVMTVEGAVKDLMDVD